jgi:dienelactone hydrolase
MISRRCVLGLLLLTLAPGCRAETPHASGAASPESLRRDFRSLVFEGRTVRPLLPRTVLTHTAEGRRVERVQFETEPGEQAVAAIARPETAAGRLPAVIVQHYLGGTKDDPLIQGLVWQLAGRGYLAIAIDGRFRGERGATSLQQAMDRAFETGKGRPWLIDTVYDLLRTVDYLASRPDVDPKRIGMVGISEGGIETWMAAAADERIAAAVPIIGVTRFASAISDLSSPDGRARVKLFEPFLQRAAHRMGETAVTEKVVREAWDRLVPGLRDRFDADRLLPLIAPRPLLILNHERDELMPLQGAREAYAAARRRYVSLGAADRIRLDVAPGLPHKGQDPTEIVAMFEWLDRWLKPASSSGSGKPLSGAEVGHQSP